MYRSPDPVKKRRHRDLFAEILDSHLKDRRKTLVSRLDLTGTITFAQAPVMRGPAYDKTAVGSTLGNAAITAAGEEEKPKWEGTKIVRSGGKKYGQFGSGGRRDAVIADEARKARIHDLKEKTKKASKWGSKTGGSSDW